MKKWAITVIGVVTVFLSVAQRDSLHAAYGNTSLSDSLRIAAAFELVEYYFRHLNDEDSVRMSLEMAHKLAEKTSSRWDDANVDRMMGGHLYRIAKYDSAYILLSRSLEAFRKLNDSTMIARTYINLSAYYERQQQLKEATEATIAAADIFEAQGDYKSLSITYSNLALTFSKQEDFERCLEYRKLAYKYSRDADPYYQSYFASQLGSIYGEMQLYDSTNSSYTDSLLKYANEGLEIAQKHNLPRAELRALGQLISYHYVIEKNYELALLFAKNLLIKAKKYRYPKYICEGYYKTADILIEMKQYEEADRYADSALYTAQEANWDYYQMVGYERIYDANKKAGNYDVALAAYEQFKLIEDSLVNVEKTSAINELEKKYQSEKKKQEVAELQREAALREVQLQRRNLLIIVAVVLLVVLALVGYLLYKQRELNAQQRIATIEQRLLRAQINPHFFFNALSSIQTFFLKEQDGKKAVLYLSRFARLMRLVLESSSEEYVTLKEETEALEAYLELQQMRFKDAFVYSIQVDERINQHETAIPPMFAQPFIENALEHGLLPKDGQGKIDISFTLDDDTISFVVEDNGVGMERSSEIRRSKAKEHRSRATQITRDRLYLLNRGRSRKIEMVLEDIEDASGAVVGARVKIGLPFKHVV